MDKLIWYVWYACTVTDLACVLACACHIFSYWAFSALHRHVAGNVLGLCSEWEEVSVILTLSSVSVIPRQQYKPSFWAARTEEGGGVTWCPQYPQCPHTHQRMLRCSWSFLCNCCIKIEPAVFGKCCLCCGIDWFPMSLTLQGCF